MNTQTMLDELKKLGKVTINHFNREKIVDYGWDTKDSLNKARYYTSVTLELPGDKAPWILTEDAVCSHKDQPIRKRGLSIAVARLYKQAIKAGLVN